MKRLLALLLLLVFLLSFVGCEIPEIDPDDKEPDDEKPNEEEPNDEKPNEDKPEAKKINNILSSDTLSCAAGAEIEIPIRIENNEGICGFELVFSYDESSVTPMDVLASDATSCGEFNDSIDSTDESGFSVVWSGIENITEDVKLFSMKFKISEKVNEAIKIGVSYVKENTVNDDLEEIGLVCDEITIYIKSEG